MKLLHFLLALLLLSSGIWAKTTGPATFKGDLERWNKVILEFNGPQASETDATNPFLDYRLQVEFTKGTKKYSVPGFFVADGDAANTGATSGNKWHVNFNPSEVGTWNYKVYFKKGTNVAVSGSNTEGTGVAGLDGTTGTFDVTETDKTGRDMRAKGRLEYVGKHHLQFAGTKEYFIKTGPDAPENFLAYYDIDNTGYGRSDLMKTWQPHVKDWKTGDPTWKNGKGKGIIGAINYLASKKMNSVSFLTMNAPVGDDKNVFPWIDVNKRTRYDVSKLAQWEIIFSHAEKMGLYLHFKTQETEGEKILDNGALGTERKLYYRELIARFAQHNALNWNICEEGRASWSSTNQTEEQQRASIAYFADNDPYKSNIVLHTAPGLSGQKAIYTDYLGDGSKLTGVSLQNEWDAVFDCTKYWVDESDKAGKPWVVSNDEQGGAQVGVPSDGYQGTSKYPNKDGIRKKTLWGNLMAGGTGVEYYFGYGKPDGVQVDILFNYSDMTCQDYRSRDMSWNYASYALAFFDIYIPFWDMHNDDSKTTNGHLLMKDNEVYVVYLENGGTANVTLGSGTYNVDWYNPKAGGALIAGKTGIAGGGSRSIGSSPNTSHDWVALIRNTTFTHVPQTGNGFSATNTSPTDTTVTDTTAADTTVTDTTAADTTVQESYKALSIPGIIEAEDYDKGGEGVAYHDIDETNKLGKYRTDGVDIEACSEGGFDIGWIADGEWLEYTVDVSTAGTYSIDFRTSALSKAGSIVVSVDGTEVTGNIDLPITNDWQSYKTTSVGGISLSKGIHVIRTFVMTGGFNLNNMTFKLTSAAAVNDVSFTSVTENIIPSKTVSASVNYTATEDLEVVLILNDSTGTWLGNTKQTVSAGTGTLDMAINLANELPIGNGYKLACTIRKVGGNFADNLAIDDTLINVVGSTSVKIATKNSELLKIYPNPSRAIINVSSAVDGNAFLVTPLGVVIKKLAKGENSILKLKKGIYFVVIKKDGDIKTAVPFYKIK